MTANICCAGTDVNKQKVTLVATPAPQIKVEKTTEIPTPAPDSDYWDNDDFVPFQSNRHDEFDWTLTKVQLN